MFSGELKAQAQELVERYPVGRSALLPLLHLLQAQDGYVTEEGVGEIAEMLGLSKAEVAGVATFYTMYKRAPLGRHLVSVCINFSCKVRGAADVYERLSRKLGVGHNETTPDGLFTLEHAECLGNCEGAPVVTVDYLNYECMTPEQAEELVDRIAAGEIPPPTRGPIPPGVREVSTQLAGLRSPAGESAPQAAPLASGADPLRRGLDEDHTADEQRAAADEVSDVADQPADRVEAQAAPGREREFQTDEGPTATVPEGTPQADPEQQPHHTEHEPAHGGEVPDPQQPRPPLDDQEQGRA